MAYGKTSRQKVKVHFNQNKRQQQNKKKYITHKPTDKNHKRNVGCAANRKVCHTKHEYEFFECIECQRNQKLLQK